MTHTFLLDVEEVEVPPKLKLNCIVGEVLNLKLERTLKAAHAAAERRYSKAMICIFIGI